VLDVGTDEQIKQSKKAKTEAKCKLDYVTVGGVFGIRKHGELLEISGYASIDIDHIGNIHELKDKLKQDEYITMLFISPSGNGLKAIIKVPEDKYDYSSHVEQFYYYLHKQYNIPLQKLDKATKDITRACFVSYDADAYFNADSTIFTQLAPVKEVKTSEKTTEVKKWVEDFLIDYCTTHDLPEGSRHNTVEKNLAILVRNKPNRDIILRDYCDRQGQNMSTFDGWLTNDEYSEVSSGELVNYIKDNNIPFNTLEDIQIKNLSELRERVLLAIATKKRGTASEIIVKSISDDNYIYTTRDDIKPEMWIYKEGVYIPQGKTYITEYVRTILGPVFTTHFCNEVIAKIEADTHINQDEFFSHNIIHEVPLNNGILDLKTRELGPFSPEKIFFNKLPVTYNPQATCDNIDRHFNAILKHKEDVPVMYEIFGYLLWKEYFIEKSVMLSGNGRNGKSKTVELMKRFIGANNCSNIPLQDLETKDFALGELFGKMANLSADLSTTALKTTGNFKTLTGRDMVSADRKFLSRIHYVNYAKMVFCANELPKTYDESTAFWNRWEPLEFPYTFVSQKEYDAAKDKKPLKIADTDIVAKLTLDLELSGLLNKALDGLDRLREKRDFSSNKNAAEIKHMWIRQSDSFAAFLMDECEEEYGSYITKQKLSEQYHKYCGINKVKPRGTLSVKHTMSLKGYWDSKKTTNTESFDGRESVWEGIKFKTKTDETVEKTQKPAVEVQKCI